MKQIDRSRYGEYIINDNYFCQDSPFKRASDMSVICESLPQREHQHMKKC